MIQVQIIGDGKDAQTRAASRFFSDRKIVVSFVNLRERSLSEGELKNIASALGGFDFLIDTDSKAYKEKGLSHFEYDPFEELLENNFLLKTPVVRCKSKATVGYSKEVENIWKGWIVQNG